MKARVVAEATEELDCWTCGRPVKVVRLSRSMPEAFGHIEPRRNGDKHPVLRIRSSSVRLARAARNGAEAPTELPEGPNSREDARPLRRMTNSTRAASNGSPRTSDPSEAPSPARAGRVAAGLPPAPAPRSARAG